MKVAKKFSRAIKNTKKFVKSWSLHIQIVIVTKFCTFHLPTGAKEDEQTRPAAV